MRDKKRSCEATKYAQTGWCWSNSIIFLDQHHPGAHQEMGHPSSAVWRGHYFGLPIHSHLHKPAVLSTSALFEISHELHERLDARLWERVINGGAHSTNQAVPL